MFAALLTPKCFSTANKGQSLFVLDPYLFRLLPISYLCNQDMSSRHAMFLQVQTLKAQAAQQQGQLQAQLQEARSLEEQLRSAASDRASLEHNLAKQADESQHQLAEQQQAFNKLQQQLDDAEAQLGQLQSHKAHEQQLSVAQQQHADRNRDAVSALEAQLSKSQAEVASLADARQQLQQQLGERTIVLGQKAHQIALLTAQLNEAKSLPDNRPAQGESVEAPSAPKCFSNAIMLVL